MTTIILIPVLSDGCVAQFDQPYSLLCEEGGILAELVSQTGPAARKRLMDIARTAFSEDKDTSGDPEGDIGIKL